MQRLGSGLAMTLATLAAVLLLAGCASMDTVRDARGQGEKRVFAAPLETVYSAVLKVAAKEGLEVVEQERDRSRLLLSHGLTAWSWGERIAIFFAPAAKRGIEVEIVSKAVLSPLNFPPDWPNKIFTGLETELAARK